MSDADVLLRATRHATAYLNSLGTRPIATEAGIETLRTRLGGPVPETGLPPEQVIDELVRGVEGGILGSASGRFFGWVIGGALPAAVAADWLTAAWDQNAVAVAASPAAAVIEEVCGAWLKDLLGLPASASFAFVTGCQMAHTTALAAARHKLLQDRGWDVDRQGLTGGPPIRVLASEERHESILRAVRLLGIGTDAVEPLACDDAGAIRMADLDVALNHAAGAPTILCLQAGELNSGAFDRFTEARALAQAAKAWVHVDGAFGLWAATSARYRHLLDGVAQADSWATDGHKWLNLPFDSGFVFVADPAAHQAPFMQLASYSIRAEGAREPKDWNPEWSRRARGFAAYAVIRSLGRAGIAQMVERCCAHADRLVTGLGALPGVEVLAQPRINQGLVRFIAADGGHDSHTDRVIEAVRADGVAWFGGTTWRGQRAMRISVCNWRTTEADIQRSIDAVWAALERSGS